MTTLAGSTPVRAAGFANQSTVLSGGGSGPRRGGYPVVVVAVLLVSGCTSETEVVFYDGGGHHFTILEQWQVGRIAARAAREARTVMPAQPSELTIRVRAGQAVISETGETGEAAPPSTIYWMVDPSRPGGVVGVARRQLRATLFHECAHLVRSAAVGPPTTVLDRAVFEGLATVVERDSAGSPVPWGRYPPDVEKWFQEVASLPADAPPQPWLGRHPDGRRWVAHKVGTYLVDRAVRASGRSAVELLGAATSEVARLGR